jgi:hypothetical protein
MSSWASLGICNYLEPLPTPIFGVLHLEITTDIFMECFEAKGEQEKGIPWHTGEGT